MQDLRDDILAAFESHAKGHVDKHRMNVEVYLSHAINKGFNSSSNRGIVITSILS